MKWFRGVEKVDGLDSPKTIFAEIRSIVVTSSEKTSEPMTLKKVVDAVFLTKKNRRLFWIGGALVVLLAFSGGTVVTFFANNVFERYLIGVSVAIGMG